MYRRRILQAAFGFILCGLLVPAVRADITTGLLGYWPLDGDATDVSGHNLNGTISGDVEPAADRLDYPDSAMSFTGEADCCITVPDSPELQITGELTLAAWVFLNADNANNARIIAKSGAGGSRSWSLNIELNSGGVDLPATFQVALDGSTNLSVRDTQSLPTDQWVHMVGVYRPGEAMEVYVNGELRAVNTEGIPGAQFSDNGLPMMIGSRNGCTNCGWDGLIDEARVYTRALSPEDILELFQFHPAPRVKAWNPDPADGMEDASLPLLSWKAGVTALLHNVYVGTDPNLTEADLVGPRTPLTVYWYAPLLQPGQVYYWRVDEIEADGQTIHTGDVWSFMAQPLTVYHPEPADAANTVAPAPILTWRAGSGAAEHHVYFSDSADAVTQGLANADQGTTQETTFDPGTLAEATAYYWRVDEAAADGTVTAGPVWTFATFLRVDDFESYTDDEGSRIYETWIDGWTNGTGSTVGNIQAPFAEQAIVHSGNQSMPLDYNNANEPYYSEAEQTWTDLEDWTADDVDTLVLHVRGRTGNAAEKLYLVVEDSGGHQAVANFSDSTFFTASQWTEWRIPLSELAAAGVNLARVKTLVIGVGDRAAPVPGGAGRIYIDDIWLVRPVPTEL